MARALGFNEPLFAKRTYVAEYIPELGEINRSRFDHCAMVDPDFDTGIVASEIEIYPGISCTFDAQTHNASLERKR